MNFLKSAIFFIFLFLLSLSPVFAQSGEPRQDKLLNGLKLLIWQNPKDDKVALKLRIHSGSAFDPKDKMGVMALLSDILFPTEQTKEFFEQDLEGSFSISSNYDYIQIDVSGRSDAFLSMIETLSTALTNPPLTPENFKKVRDARIELVNGLIKNPAYLADRAAAKKLLGDFPYGRPQEGSPESLARIDRADLIIARDKFLTSDNATLTISGNVQFNFALRACKQFFGGWKKSDKLIPPTFKQPEDPSDKAFLSRIDDKEVSELRYAFRGLARNDKDFFASQILLRGIQNRIRKEEGFSGAAIYQSANTLPGVAMFSFSKWNIGMVKINGDQIALPGNFSGYVMEHLSKPLKSDEFEKAKSEVVAEMNRNSIADLWLDIDTFRLTSPKDEMQKLNAASLADAQRVAGNLSKKPVAIHLITNPGEMASK